MAVKVMLGVIKDVRDKMGFETEIFDLGGGFGIKYLQRDSPQPPEEFIGPMVERIIAFCSACGLKRPALVIEPGRWVVGEAGITLYTVGSVKEISGVTTYVGVDGGFSDNPRPALYDAGYDAVIANKYEEPPSVKTAIVGKCCESGDVLIRDIALPRAERGDVIVVFSTGAYNHSMASNYNKNPIAPVVMIRDGVPRLSVAGQTYAQMYENHL
jgi:diaminopimelate decarboxylase